MKASFFICFFFLIFPGAVHSQPARTCLNNICVSNTARRASGPNYNWIMTVQAQAPLSQSRIDSVVYYLHKTFNPRVITLRKKSNNPAYKFDLARTGWGEFNVLVKVYLHGTRTPVSINHQLKL
jgi:transcription initiation factor IIF auxiliary subunit